MLNEVERYLITFVSLSIICTMVTYQNFFFQRHQQFLGDATGAIPHFNHVNLDEYSLPDGILLEDLGVFKTLYKEHCEVMNRFNNDSLL